jgi:hypothetical protein
VQADTGEKMQMWHQPDQQIAVQGTVQDACDQRRSTLPGFIIIFGRARMHES